MIHYLTNLSDILDPNGKEHPFQLIGFASTTLKRVCRATLQAESYALQGATESGARIRALILETPGKLESLRNWHEESIKQMAHFYFSDCRSLVDHLLSPAPRKVQDKRLGIEHAALRQSIFRDGELTSVKFHPYGDHLRWVETARMLADCLTKSMKPLLLNDTMLRGFVQLS